jgi:hypothetical protein
MKYYIRKVEQVTIWEATKPIELNVKSFKKIKSNPYKGSSEEDFLNYINSLRHDLPQELEDIDYDAYDKLNDLFGGEMPQKMYTSSAENEENSWLEIGEVDDSYTKSGGFNSSYSI